MTQQSLMKLDFDDLNNSFELMPGNAQLFGATLTPEGCNFVIYAPDALEVFICIFDADEQPLAQIALQERSLSKWYGLINKVTHQHLYGIRVRPKMNSRRPLDADVSKLLIDPYAKALSRSMNWQADLYTGDSHAMVPKARIMEESTAALTPIELAPEDRIIYEAHVKGMTALHPDVPEAIRGKYLGACHPSVIAHLQTLGVTSVQFLPLMSFMSEPFITDKGLSNYWGYNPINFFAAEPKYAVNDAVAECKEMIQTYRDANIEVILDVVLNHTCESGHDGPVLSLKGLCQSQAYIIEQNYETETLHYLNFSGCGNTLKLSDTYVMNLTIDALRYWVSEMGVSGFRFDLASVLGREDFAFTNNATFFSVLRQDPVLKNALMLAEPWDIGPGGYQLGQFPDYWLEVNDKYRDVVRGFWRGDKGLKGQFATRFMGSRDIFRKNLRPMHASVNNVTYHDGYTLHDLVSYEQKHNEANLEDNRDGHNHNLSSNYGVEGFTTKPAILNLREQQKRNLFATLLLSQGTPHILGGDELSKTQGGNNNAYCQDNEINWYDWDLDERKQKFLAFCGYVINLRACNSVLKQMNFADDTFDNKQNIDKVNWYRRDGSHKSDIDWVNHEHHCFALHIVGEVEIPEDSQIITQEWLLCINSLDQDREFTLPILEHSNVWSCQLDTAIDDVSLYQMQAIAPMFTMPAQSIRLYRKQ